MWGATTTGISVCANPSDFNPRTPCGVRPTPLRAGYWAHCISIHAPRVGCDSGFSRVVHRAPPISIHAPRVGCDVTNVYTTVDKKYFNPRTPCGVRPIDVQKCVYCIQISIHAPRVGCDTPVAAQHAFQLYFNPRTPCGVRLRLCMTFIVDRLFQSTHPVWGATTEKDYTVVQMGVFQSTHPVWGATFQGSQPLFSFFISIHAPRVGCDAVQDRVNQLLRYFNPRTPCGVRQML